MPGGGYANWFLQPLEQCGTIFAQSLPRSALQTLGRVPRRSGEFGGLLIGYARGATLPGIVRAFVWTRER